MPSAPSRFKFGTFVSGKTGVLWSTVEVSKQGSAYNAVSLEYGDITATADSLEGARDMAFKLVCKRVGGVGLCFDKVQ